MPQYAENAKSAVSGAGEVITTNAPLVTVYASTAMFELATDCLQCFVLLWWLALQFLSHLLEMSRHGSLISLTNFALSELAAQMRITAQPDSTTMNLGKLFEGLSEELHILSLDCSANLKECFPQAILHERRACASDCFQENCLNHEEQMYKQIGAKSLQCQNCATVCHGKLISLG